MSNVNEALFLKPPKEGSTLRCAVCLGILEDPQQLIPCLHVFCLVCSKKLNGRCPLDRLEFTSVSIERNIKNIIEELDVRCANSNNGCTWVGEFGKVNMHIKECAFEMIPCPNCSEIFFRKNASMHADKCPHNSLPCVFACYGCTSRISKQNPEEHPANHPSHILLLLNQLQASQAQTKELSNRVLKLEEQLATKNTSSPVVSNANPTKPSPASKVTLRQVTEKINKAISGESGREGGARLYDKGQYERCYQLYRSTAEELVKQAKANGQQASWINIFEKAFQYCGQPQAKNWGTQVDGAWIMRRAFEAIKEGAYAEGEYDEEDFMTFWNRVKDINYFREME